MGYKGILVGAAVSALLATACEIVVVEIRSPVTGTVSSSDDVTVEFDAQGGPGEIRATCQLDAEAPVPCSSPHVFSDVEAGAHYVTVRAVNATGVSDTKRVRFAVDRGFSVPVKQVAAGFQHTCALLETGAVQCWGSGAALGVPGVLAIGDTEPPAHFPAVSVGGSVKHLAAGSGHTCALLSNGGIRCWGYSHSGELGYGNTASIGYDQPPSSAGEVPLGGTAVQVTAGSSHNCALLATGAVRCWGDSSWGKLGYGNGNPIGDDELPLSAGDVNVGGRVIQVSAGGEHTCAVLATGAVSCWGHGGYGKLGNGNTAHVGDDEVPASLGFIDLGGRVLQVATGRDHTCALLADGRVRCWGRGDYGALGYGSNESLLTPGGYVDVGGRATQITGGDGYTCVLLTTGKLRCWGSRATGHASEDRFALPSANGDVPIGGDVVQLSAGSFHACAVLSSARVRCWGSGSSGQLGYPGVEYVPIAGSAGDVNVAFGPASSLIPVP